MGETLDRNAAAHLLRRTGYGPSVEEIDAFVGLSRAEAVSRVTDLSAVTMPARPGFLHNEQWKAARDATNWWIGRMMTSPVPLVEKMTMFWHGHFCSAQDKVSNFPAMFDQNQLFREKALGNFVELTKAVSVGGAMLAYLDNETNRAGAVQENFARELMELFTCGLGHYTEADVVEMARAWTGHGTVGRVGGRHDLTYRFRPEHHDHGPKTLFGKTRNWNGPETIDELCTGSRAVPTSRFIAAKVFRYFAHLDPSENVVDELAGTFRSSGLSILALVRAVLSHDEFWSARSRYALVRPPVDFVASLLRVSGADVDIVATKWHLSPMGQEPFEPPGVDGWGQNSYWLSTSSAWTRASFVTWLRWKLKDTGMLSDVKTMSSPAAVDLALRSFGIVDPHPATRNKLRDLVDGLHRQRTGWAVRPQLFCAVALSPDFQLH